MANPNTAAPAAPAHAPGSTDARPADGLYPLTDHYVARMQQAQACAQALAQAAIAHPGAQRFVVAMATAKASPVPAGVRFASWAELADTVEQYGAFIESDDLQRLANACVARLAARVACQPVRGV